MRFLARRQRLKVLVLGGTRNLGHLLAAALLEAGHDLTILNRGITPDDLPGAVARLRADRSDRRALAAAIGGRSWDAVIDLTLYTGADADAAAAIFAGRTDRLVFISTGQVYLVREDAPRPAREEDADGPTVAEPDRGTPDHADWMYGVEKRKAERVLLGARGRGQFDVVILRLPMIHSPRDHYDRVHNYLCRLWDGEPLLVPDDGGLTVRHVWVYDVIRAIISALAPSLHSSGEPVYNIGQDDTYSFHETLALLAKAAGMPLRVATVPRGVLQKEKLLPACSPFSGRWMSALDNARSRRNLGLSYTPMPAYLAELAVAYRNPERVPPAGYAHRERELDLLRRGVAR